MRLWLAVWVWLSLAIGAVAAPARHPHVLDHANYLFENTVDDIEAASVRLRRATGVELFVVAEPTLGGQSAREFAIDLPIWDPAREQVVLLVALTEREVRIEASPSVSRHITDREWTELIQREILPKLRSGHNGSAVRAGVAAISSRLTDAGEPAEPQVGFFGDPRGLRDILFVLAAGFLAGVSFSNTRHLKVARGRW